LLSATPTAISTSKIISFEGISGQKKNFYKFGSMAQSVKCFRWREWRTRHSGATGWELVSHFSDVWCSSLLQLTRVSIWQLESLFRCQTWPRWMYVFKIEVKWEDKSGIIWFYIVLYTEETKLPRIHSITAATDCTKMPRLVATWRSFMELPPKPTNWRVIKNYVEWNSRALIFPLLSRNFIVIPAIQQLLSECRCRSYLHDFSQGPHKGFCSVHLILGVWITKAKSKQEL